MSDFKIAYSPIYVYSLPEGHRFPMSKYELLPQQLLREGTAAEEDFFSPGRISDEDILRVHTSDFLRKLTTLDLTRREIRDIGFPVRDDLIERGRHIAQGTIDCAKYAMQHGVSLNIAGGTHHSFADHGEGFCVFNDIAIAAAHLLHHDLVRQVLVVDLDVHQGNGTASIFSEEQRVYTWSVHGDRNYPLRKMQSDLDTPLPDDTQDEVYLDTISEILPRLIDEVRPDMIFYQAGVDILDTDKLGRLFVSKEGCKERDRIVLEHARDAGIPIAVTMGGGYSVRIADVIDAHANTFRMSKELYF